MKRMIQYYSGTNTEELHSRRYLISLLVLVLVILLLCYFHYLFFVSPVKAKEDSIYEVANETIPNEEEISEEPIEEVSKIEEPTSEETIVNKWEQLQEINGDIVGWITVPETTIDYPVMQTLNNTDYLKLDFYRNYSIFGTPFLDYNVNLQKKSKNIVMYGHSVNENELMGQFHKYLDQEYYEENKLFMFNTIYEDNTYEIIAVCLLPDSGENMIDYTQVTFFHPDMLKEYIDNMVAVSSITNTSTYSANDYFLTIQTCSKEFEGAKLVILAKEVS